jgi:hypothetical protein
MTNKEKILQLREKHEPLFNQLGLDNPTFVPKMFYKKSGGEFIKMFTSEVSSGKDLYTERVSREYESEDETRTLYKWKHNPYYDTEYPREPFNSAVQKGVFVYTIPVDELEVIEPIKKGISTVGRIKESDFELPDPDLDLPMSQMTLRDYACIKLKTPQSFKPWLNEIILKA